MDSPSTEFNYLSIYVTNDNELKNLYIEKIKQHNEKIIGNPFPDSGFDLYCPSNVPIYHELKCKIDLNVKCAMYKYVEKDGMFTKKYIGYYLYPRSSISKTPLRLTNSVGIIDSGYRGNICAAVDNNNKEIFEIEKHQRYFQLCSPTLEPLIVELIDNVDLFESTNRGEGGFGSTGK